jgi:hypothetical protein
MPTLYRAARGYVSIARLIGAAFYGTIAILTLALAIWLAHPFGASWMWTGLGIFVGLQGAALGFKAAELYLSARPEPQ